MTETTPHHIRAADHCTPARTAPRRELVVDAIRALGPAGARSRQIRDRTGLTSKALSALLIQYIRAGRVFAVGPRMARVYFIEREQSVAYAATLDVQQRATGPRTRASKTPGRFNRAWQHQAAEVIIPANVKRTVRSAPPGRFEVTSPVVGLFGAMRPGQYPDEANFSRYLDTQAKEGV